MVDDSETIRDECVSLISIQDHNRIFLGIVAPTIQRDEDDVTSSDVTTTRKQHFTTSAVLPLP
jgi:hypothetical protein